MGRLSVGGATLGGATDVGGGGGDAGGAAGGGGEAAAGGGDGLRVTGACEVARGSAGGERVIPPGNNADNATANTRHA